ncbi:MAG: 3-methyl-2-oxobutanoate hydroxymethyltransferase [Phycisphaerales bacterium]|nr:3-methyl-2-oxobutanoate hydroxymethyltransferase [Phycisphaerales bacterium]
MSTNTSVESKPQKAPTSLEGSVTLRTLRRWSNAGSKWACLTCYDATTARWMAGAGLPTILVGDTAAEMILGYDSTIHAPLDFLITITAAVKRGAPNVFVMGDMPFLSYQVDESSAIQNAGRFLTEGTADAVKLEVDGKWTRRVEAICDAGIATVAHLGSRPQQAKQTGGYTTAGRTSKEAKIIVEDAIAMEQAGASMLLLEAVPEEVSIAVVEGTSIPVIGCGAGTACHGQVVVMQDLAGMTAWQPSFAKPTASIGDSIASVATTWMQNVVTNNLGKHPYNMHEGESERFRTQG